MEGKSRSQTVVRNYLKDPKSHGTRKRPDRPPKITNAADVDFFKKLLKDNQAQEICKNLKIYPSLQEEGCKIAYCHSDNLFILICN